ncbi:membrane protein insertase YidC [Geomicrobium sp. JSM 1781026]|uniref:membrane protein insertase YidC n=1 Tax=Geomicrobium sp. JSM 1781026 TaxID=3344580 RepID=UPI0035C1B720
MKNKSIVLLIIALMVVLLSACGVDQAPITSESEGIWNHFFVFPLSWLIIQIAGILNGSYGLSIVVMTIMIRLLILPLFLKQQKSSKAMQQLRPELEELRGKYDPKNPDDQKKMQQDMISLYQKSGVNPAAGCLPVVIQMPILMAFYFAIIRTEQIATHSFLWMNLGEPDPYMIMPVVAGLLMLGQVQLSSRQMPAEMAAQMKMIQYIMPVMIVFIGFALPSALSLYWATGSLFMIVQSFLIQTREKKKEINQDVVPER